MTTRYGMVKVSKVRAAYDELRRAVRSGDVEAADKALDRYEPWADYVFSEKAVRLITMQDVRLRAGEGALTANDVLAAVNAEITSRAGGDT